MSQVKPTPEGYHALTPSLVVPDTVEAIEVYKKVFDASNRYVLERSFFAGEGSVRPYLESGDSH